MTEMIRKDVQLAVQCALVERMPELMTPAHYANGLRDSLRGMVDQTSRQVQPPIDLPPHF